MDELQGLADAQRHFRLSNLLETEKANTDPRRAGFADLLAETIEDIDRLQKDANAGFEGLLTGEEQDLHSVMTRMNEADLALRFALEARNRLLEAYQELQRMPI
ncbi:MAG: flagellar hook-basal body complex protein FliE [Planctomycetes bacterium]|nr:flagellar hook-basal body complex protein FliE [Planctomycetota bacterium]